MDVAGGLRRRRSVDASREERQGLRARARAQSRRELSVYRRHLGLSNSQVGHVLLAARPRRVGRRGPPDERGDPSHLRVPHRLVHAVGASLANAAHCSEPLRPWDRAGVLYCGEECTRKARCVLWDKKCETYDSCRRQSERHRIRRKAAESYTSCSIGCSILSCSEPLIRPPQSHAVQSLFPCRHIRAMDGHSSSCAPRGRIRFA